MEGVKRLIVLTVLVLALIAGVPASAGVRPCVYVQVDGYAVWQCSPLVVYEMHCAAVTVTGSPYIYGSACVPTELPPP